MSQSKIWGSGVSLSLCSTCCALVSVSSSSLTTLCRVFYKRLLPQITVSPAIVMFLLKFDSKEKYVNIQKCWISNWTWLFSKLLRSWNLIFCCTSSFALYLLLVFWWLKWISCCTFKRIFINVIILVTILLLFPVNQLRIGLINPNLVEEYL